METISKHIGEGFGKGELYAALAYDSSDAFGGMKIKALMLNSTGRISFCDANAYIYSSTSTQLDLVGTTIDLVGTLEGGWANSKYVLYVNKTTTVASGDQTGERGRPYDEIQDAVAKVISNADNADAVNYIIMVAPGTYTTMINLDSAALYNLSIIAEGGPHSVIVNVATGNALECNSVNDHLHYLYIKGVDFWDPINFLGANAETNFLSKQCIFEDCSLSNGGLDTGHTGATMLTLNNAGRFYWKNGSIHVLDSIHITNVASCGIRGESYRDIFSLTGAPGTTTLVANSGANHPVAFSDAGDMMTYYILSAYVQRQEPTLTCTAGIVRYWLRNSYCGLAMGLTIPSSGHLYSHNSVFPGNVTLAAGSVGKLYKSHIRGTFTSSSTDLKIYGTTEGEALTVAS